MLMEMPKNKMKLKNLLGPQQMAEVKAKIAGFERFLKDHKNSSFKREREADETFARQELKRYKAMLVERSPQEVTGTERTKIYQRVKYLESKIKEGMPTQDEMMGKRHSHVDNPSSKYQEAEGSVVDRQVKWTLANQARIKEWKHLKRILEPNDPGSTNVEMLRRIN